MGVDPTLLRRYLRQRAELGERELFLDGLTADEALALARKAGSEDAPTVAVPPPAGPGAETADAEGTASADATPSSEGPGPAMEQRADPGGPGALKVLGREASGCTRCRLHEGRTNVVFGEGSATAEVVVVGEAPGAREDRTGRPFVGRAGKLLDLLLMSVGLPRDEVYICNVLKCRPPNNRNPQADEVEQCSAYLHRQLDLIQPTVLLAVGKFAAQTLSGKATSIGRLRGQIHSYRGVPLVATYHPAYLLRSPQRTRTVWEDLQLLRQVLDEQR